MESSMKQLGTAYEAVQKEVKAMQAEVTSLKDQKTKQKKEFQELLENNNRLRKLTCHEWFKDSGLHLNWDEKFLTQEAAVYRKQFFHGKVKYRLEMFLTKADTFQGKVTCSFQLTEAGPRGLHIDFDGQKVMSYQINGRDVTEEIQQIWNGKYLLMPAGYLNQGANTYEITFQAGYVNDGNGFHSMTDSDGKQYVYTTTEPYFGNRVFPMFDQPNLKASYHLIACAPEDWTVISNNLLVKKSKAQKHNQAFFDEQESDFFVWDFGESQVFSTYLFCMCAGPFLEVKCEQPGVTRSMTAYVRASLLEHLKKQLDEIFEMTIKCMEFYESFFGFKHPFPKYDYVFCPEYNMGAMENPGCITVNDAYVFKGDISLRQRMWMACIVTHELAHMWFGNLVTMDWWNDLWLNESFADFICFIAMDNFTLKTPLSSVGIQWNQRKNWGYGADMAPTTHPIAGDVANTAKAETIFDGITYSKGAATMRQLMFRVGQKTFSKAMTSYFNKYAWKNTKLQDLLTEMQKAVQEDHGEIEKGTVLDIEHFNAEWINTAGLNVITPQWDPSDTSTEAKMTIIQEACLPEHPTLRIHSILVGFFDENGDVYQSMKVAVQGQKETVVTYDGSKQPKAVLLNYQDEDFVKVRCDESSIEWFKTNLNKVSGELDKVLIWRVLWDMVRDARMPAPVYVKLACNSMPTETSASLVANMLMFSNGCVGNYTSPQFRPRLRKMLFDATHKALANCSNDKIMILFKKYLPMFTRTADQVQVLLDILEGKMDGVEFKLDAKWAVVTKVFQYGKHSDEEKWAFYQRVADEDKSDMAVKRKRLYEACHMSEEARAALWTQIMDPETEASQRELSYSMSGFNGSHQKSEVMQPYWEKYFTELVNIFKTRDNQFAKTFYHNMDPNCDDLKWKLDSYNKVMESLQGNEWAEKLLNTEISTLERQIKVIAYCTANYKPE